MSQDNILLITTDQQRFDTIQALGNSSIYTPHLNYLYTQGHRLYPLLSRLSHLCAFPHHSDDRPARV